MPLERGDPRVHRDRPGLADLQDPEVLPDLPENRLVLKIKFKTLS